MTTLLEIDAFARACQLSEAAVQALAVRGAISGARQIKRRWLFPKDSQIYIPPSVPALTPPIKWVGGKRWLVNHLAPLWAPHAGRCRLVEPFAGGAAVSLGLRTQRALINDINPYLINFYQHVKDGLRISLPLENTPKVFYRCRTEFNAMIARGERSSRRSAMVFYALSKLCFNGVFRLNASGFYNVPHGRHKTVTFARRFPEHQAAFKHWTFSSRDYAKLTLRPSDFLFVDPPYCALSKTAYFTHYAAGGFSWEDQVKLVRWLDRHPGPIIATNHAVPELMDLYRDHHFEIAVLDAPRRVSCTGNRTPAKEMLATRGLTPR